jgi:hypothetical protein
MTALHAPLTLASHPAGVSTPTSCARTTTCAPPNSAIPLLDNACSHPSPATTTTHARSILATPPQDACTHRTFAMTTTCAPMASASNQLAIAHSRM